MRSRRAPSSFRNRNLSRSESYARLSRSLSRRVPRAAGATRRSSLKSAKKQTRQTRSASPKRKAGSRKVVRSA